MNPYSYQTSTTSTLSIEPVFYTEATYCSEQQKFTTTCVTYKPDTWFKKKLADLLEHRTKAFEKLASI